jgi:DNA-binding transcriptional LysR family regulator
MELRHLRYFVAVAEELNIRRAAVRLHVSQPPLTRQIRDLEDEIKVQLFERSKFGVQLTDAGRIFLAEARQILLHSDRAARLAQGALRGESGRLEVAVPPMPMDRALSRVLRKYRRQFPHWAVHVHEMPTRVQFEGLLDKDIDLAFCAFRSAEPGLTFKAVRRVAICAVLTPGHSLAKQNRVALGDLCDESFILPARKTALYYDWYVNLCRSAGFEPKIAQETETTQNMLSLVSAGLGVALVPETVRPFETATEVEFREIYPNTPYLTFYLAWRRNDLSPPLKSFLQTFTTHTDIKTTTQ